MSDQWQTIERIFHEALAQAESERRAFVRESCLGNPGLMREVESLLWHHAQATTRFDSALEPVASDLLKGTLAAADLPKGAMLAAYRIDHKLGEGGMGTVYAATDTRLDRQVAVKVVNRTIAGTLEARARFLREARSAAALAHPNIAILHDVGETGDTPWIVMEYVAGTPLRSKLQSGPLGESALMRYATQLAAALQHAHARRIIHRDIKPENIIITDEGNLKVIDFGLAKVVSDNLTVPVAITHPRAFAGTLAYAAPELLSGAEASARGDVYSAGVVLYEMACGQHPFAGLSSPSLVAAILAGDHPVLNARNPTLAAGVAAVIERCISRDPAARYRDGAELAAALCIASTAGENQIDNAGCPCVAILDFVNIAGGSEREWLGSGIAETLSAGLAKLKSMRVVSRGRVLQVIRRIGDPQNDPAAAAELGRELAARWIVAGVYQRSADRIRMTPKLIDSITGDVLPIENIDGHWEDRFNLQDRVIRALTKVLTDRFETASQHRILAPETRNLMAYEHYTRGRQQMQAMHGKSLEDAIAHFEKAVAVDPAYALAYSGLGTAHALQFIRTSSREDATRASECLERAIELDPELGEPYPWLCNIRMRRNDPQGAFAAGAKGVEMQPDLAQAHYFYGGIHYMCSECRLGDMQSGPYHLAETIRLQPEFHPGWLNLGGIAIWLGRHHTAAQILSEAVRLEEEPGVVWRFVGARTLLGIALMRAGEWDRSRARHLNAIESLKNSEHVYRDTFIILSACGLGDIELRCGNARVALTHYRHAGRLLKELPRMVGCARLLIRAGAGLAAAYAGSGELERARELASDASAQIKVVAGNIATVTFECSLGQLNLALVVTELRLGHIDQAAAFVAAARQAGWMDLPWLLTDPELRPLHGHPLFLSFLEELRCTPAIDVPLPAGIQHAMGQESTG